VSIARFIAMRALLALPTILILLTIVFFVMRIIPGDPITAMVGMKAPPQRIEELRRMAGLDKPIYVQYVEYLSGVFRGDLGRSMIWGRRPVITEILDRFPATLELTISAFIVSIAIGFATGMFAASRKGRAPDTAVRFYGILAWTLFIPWFGMILQLIFGVWLRLLPVGSRIDAGLEPPTITGLYVIDSVITGRWDSFVSAVKHLVLPSITLGVVLSGAYTRLVRNNIVDVLNQDFMVTYRAMGFPPPKVLLKAVRNALIPLVTMMGLQFALLLAGAVLTETTFSWPGMGTFLLERIIYVDYTCVQGTIVFYAIFVVAINFIVDVIYALIDPRVRY